MTKNKRKATAVALASTLMVGSFAFAYLSTSDVADSTNTITAGNFTLAITNELKAAAGEVGAFELTKTYPMSQAEGEALTPAVFTVQNSGDIPFVLRLGATNVAKSDTATAELPQGLIKVLIKSGDATVYSGTLADFNNTNGAGEAMAVDAGASKDFTILAYIDEAAGNADLYGDAGNEVRDIQFQVKAYAVQRDGGLFSSTDYTAEWNSIAAPLF